ncbi:hypothetical protein PROFUN_15490 [Planoprotostelium fungivorum]|uniref:Uncharacterized protein n=1 Tax=Planoprotostelium fungivorum TaxID=1890364 RepID=A0A2P6MW13_9EUKA|nr:hypothetical protein PROFUN_15490 [Planoprotostelium fungivorum]
MSNVVNKLAETAKKTIQNFNPPKNTGKEVFDPFFTSVAQRTMSVPGVYRNPSPGSAVEETTNVPKTEQLANRYNFQIQERNLAHLREQRNPNPESGSAHWFPNLECNMNKHDHYAWLKVRPHHLNMKGKWFT